MKWRAKGAEPPPDPVLDERIGPHRVLVEQRPDGRYAARVLLKDDGSAWSMIAVNKLPSQCLLQAAARLGYEPDEFS